MIVPDVSLISRIAAGDRAAFGEFYDRHAPSIFGVLTRLLRDRSEAEDTLQEVFLQVWREASRYDVGRAGPKVWLFLIARSRATDRLRRRGPTTSLGNGESAIHAEPASQLEKQEAASALQLALAALPELQRSAILDAFFGRQSYEAVARQQGGGGGDNQDTHSTGHVPPA